MAITPRSLFRSPLLLAVSCLTWLALGSAAFVMFTGPCKASKVHVEPAVQTFEVKQVEVVEYQQVKPEATGHGWLGIQIMTMNHHRAKYAGVANVRGVLITGIMDNFPAQTSGFAPYDIVTHFDGQPVTTAPQLKCRVMGSTPGERVPVKVIRNGQKLTLYPTLGDRPRELVRR